MWLKDVRPEVTLERTYATKFMANHYLSWNISKPIEYWSFESVIWTNTNDRGFDMYFVNPIIFLSRCRVCCFGKNRKWRFWA